MEYNDAYVLWYRRHTRMLIGHPEPHVDRDFYIGLSTSASNMAQTLEKIHNQVPPFLLGTPDINEIRNTMNRLHIDIETRLKNASEEGRILPMQTIHVEQPYVPTFDVPKRRNPTEDVGVMIQMTVIVHGIHTFSTIYG